MRSTMKRAGNRAGTTSQRLLNVTQRMPLFTGQRTVNMATKRVQYLHLHQFTPWLMRILRPAIASQFESNQCVGHWSLSICPPVIILGVVSWLLGHVICTTISVKSSFAWNLICWRVFRAGCRASSPQKTVKRPQFTAQARWILCNLCVYTPGTWPGGSVEGPRIHMAFC